MDTPNTTAPAQTIYPPLSAIERRPYRELAQMKPAEDGTMKIAPRTLLRLLAQVEAQEQQLLQYKRQQDGLRGLATAWQKPDNSDDYQDAATEVSAVLDDEHYGDPAYADQDPDHDGHGWVAPFHEQRKGKRPASLHPFDVERAPAELWNYLSTMLPEEEYESHATQLRRRYVLAIALYFWEGAGRPACTLAHVLATIACQDLEAVVRMLQTVPALAELAQPIAAALELSDQRTLEAIGNGLRLPLRRVEFGQEARQVITGHLAPFAY